MTKRRAKGLPDVFGEHGVRVFTERCSSCVYRPGNLMDLRPGRLADLQQSNLSKDSHLTCHQTLDRKRGQRVACRGFYDFAHLRVTIFQLADRLGMVEWVTPGGPDAKHMESGVAGRSSPDGSDACDNDATIDSGS